MWSKRTEGFWKCGLAAGKRRIKRKIFIILVFLLFGMLGCSNRTKTTENKSEVQNLEKKSELQNAEYNCEVQNIEKCSQVQAIEQSNDKEAEKITECYRDIYEKAAKDETLGELAVVQSIVTRLGENGYCAVDSENQINMTGAKKVEQFCQKADAGKKAEITILVVAYDGGFTKYDLITSEGKVNVTRGYYQYCNGQMNRMSVKSYPAYLWKYTKEGYLFFQEHHMSGYDGMNEYVALRVQPLDEACRELNRKYMLPIGYKRNNMFLSDWNEDDFGELNFYDLFDIFYPIVKGKSMPYVADENCNIGAVYHIPKEEFESVILPYFPINSETLQSKTTYGAEEKSYEYRPRGLEDCEPPEIPYPEVVDYTENKDGTITLTVNVVYPKESSSKVFAHEVTVRPLGDGEVQYVSNRIILSDENFEASWHVERLAEEEWEEIYEKGYKLPVDVNEKEEAETDCKRVMEMVSNIYMQADKGDASNVVLSDETIREMQDRLKKTGNPVIAADTYSGMGNYEAMETFLEDCMVGKKGSIVVYEVRSDGGIGRRKYSFDGAKMYVLCANAAWTIENKAVLASVSYTKIKEWKYTDKGFFSYELCVPEPPEVTETIVGDVLVRVKPVNKKYMEIMEKYLLPLGYKGNNLLCSNWDAEHMENLDYNGLFQYLYTIEYGEWPEDKYTEGISKEAFESLITKYLPVTAEQLEWYAAYDAEGQTYAWAELGCGNYIPNFFGTSVSEVTNIRENEDGTLTLTVDAVCELLGNEAVISHFLTVRLQDDGSIMYVGNQISEDELQQLPEYQYRITKHANQKESP